MELLFVLSFFVIVYLFLLFQGNRKLYEQKIEEIKKLQKKNPNRIITREKFFIIDKNNELKEVSDYSEYSKLNNKDKYFEISFKDTPENRKSLEKVLFRKDN